MDEDEDLDLEDEDTDGAAADSEDEPDASGGDSDEGDAEGQEEPEARRSHGLQQAARAERRKRQDLERRLEEQHQQHQRDIEALRAQTAAPQHQEEDDIGEPDYADLKGWARKIAAKESAKAFTAAEQKRLQESSSEWNARLNDSLVDLRDEKDDAEEVLAEFVKLQNSDATGKIARRVRAESDPAGWAYRYMKKHQKRGSEADVLRKENEELRAKLAGKEPKREKPKPKRLAGARGAGARAGVQSSDDGNESPFGDALGGR